MVLAYFSLNPKPSAFITLHHRQSETTMKRVNRIMNHLSDRQVFWIHIVEVLLHPATNIASPVMLDTIVDDRTHVAEKLVMALVAQDTPSDLIRADHVGNDIPAFATKLAHVIWWLTS